MSEENVKGGEGEKKLSAVEHIKIASRGLRGGIDRELEEPKAFFEEESVQLLKTHGTYQQDDRDTRTERKKKGLDKDYKFMLRTKFPGGSISPEQYLFCHELSGKYGQSDLRITSRQCFQFHGIVRGNLRPLIHDLNTLANITSLGACGDVVRNTLAPAVADVGLEYAKCGTNLLALSQRISAYFLPKTSSYYDIWIDDQKAKVNPDGTVTYESHEPSKPVNEPIYGTQYLPRKFKIGIGTDFDNSVDVYANDVGILAVTEAGRIVGYEILAGGGLGYTHRKPETYARAATHLAFVETEDDVLHILEAIVKVQRDHGGRADRRHARMKYLIDDWGFEKFKKTVMEYAGKVYADSRGTTPKLQPHYLGWHKQMQPGLNYVGCWVENGRIRDFDEFQFRTAFHELVTKFKPDVRLTPHHNIVFANIKDSDVAAVQALLDKYHVPTDKGINTLRKMEMACPALPFCGLALAESERAMPSFIKALEDAGHGDADVMIRMSGCPNNCSRPRTAELGIVGSGSDQYQVYTGGDYLGTRLNDLLVPKVHTAELPGVVAALLDAWKAEKVNGERFGDWSRKVGVEALSGKLQGVAK
jgi:sulfite reductase (ferredoxin)